MGLLEPITADIFGLQRSNEWKQHHASHFQTPHDATLLFYYSKVHPSPFTDLFWTCQPYHSVSSLGVYLQYTKQTKNKIFLAMLELWILYHPQKCLMLTLRNVVTKSYLSPLVQILVTIKGAQWLVLASRRGTVQYCHQTALNLRNAFQFHH